VMVLLLGLLLRRGPLEEPSEKRLVRRWIIFGGLVFPGTVLTALMVYLIHTADDYDARPQAGDSIVGVTARSWWWEVRYRDPASGASFATANEIRIPVGQGVTLGLTSADVIHSLWVPALAGKVDMLPGRVHQLRLLADRAGVFRGVCAEFCGAQHARMALHVVAMAPADHAQWLVSQAAPAVRPQSEEALRGLDVYRARHCAACHEIRGLVPGPAGDAPLGPDLTHIGSRLHLGAGTLVRDAQALQHWVAHSGDLQPGVRMPAYDDLDAASLRALAAFLEQLK
jgi:cytochrome c oxidase subunit II